MLNPAKFSRDRQLDLCALCHSGVGRQELAPAFTYLPGPPLDSYLRPIPVDPTTCHRVESCTVARKPEVNIEDHCIDCRMPKQPTNAIISTTGGKEIRATMRTHWIRVYSDVRVGTE
jgi:hypothetical protein